MKNVANLQEQMKTYKHLSINAHITISALNVLYINKSTFQNFWAHKHTFVEDTRNHPARGVPVYVGQTVHPQQIGTIPVVFGGISDTSLVSVWCQLINNLLLDLGRERRANAKIIHTK